MNDSDSLRIEVGPVNNNKEEPVSGTGFELTKLRLWESSDPVYYVVDDKPLIDLRERDIELAVKLLKNLGGWKSQQFTSANGFVVDDTNPYTVSSNNNLQLAVFPSTANSKGWIQFQIDRNVDITKCLILRIAYMMNASDPGDIQINIETNIYEIGTSSPVIETHSVIETPLDVNLHEVVVDLNSTNFNNFDLAHISIERDVSVANNSSADMQIVNIIVEQNKDV